MGDFKEGIKINNDLGNKKEGPHYDVIRDLRKELGGVDKVRVTGTGEVLNGETQVGKTKVKW